MGLLLSVLITCVGVLEVIACYTHFRVGTVYNECKSNIRDIAKYYAVELRKHELHFEPGPNDSGPSTSQDTLSELIRSKTVRIQEKSQNYSNGNVHNGHILNATSSFSNTPDQGTPNLAANLKVPRNSVSGLDSPTVQRLMSPEVDITEAIVEKMQNLESNEWRRKSPSPYPDKTGLEVVEKDFWRSRSPSPFPESKDSDSGVEMIYTPGLRKTRDVSPLLETPDIAESLPHSPLFSPELLDENSAYSNTDLEVQNITESITSPGIPRQPSPYPEALFGITADSADTEDTKFDEAFLRSLDGVNKSSKCDDRRRSFKKKRNSSSTSSRASRDEISRSMTSLDEIDLVDKKPEGETKKIISPLKEEDTEVISDDTFPEKCESIASPIPEQLIDKNKEEATVTKQEKTLFEAKVAPNASQESSKPGKANLAFTEKVKDLEISVQLLVTVKGTSQGDKMEYTTTVSQDDQKPFSKKDHDVKEESVTKTTVEKSEFGNVKTSVTCGSSALPEETKPNLKDLQISSESLIHAERTVQDDVASSEAEFLKLYETFTELPEKEKDKFLQKIGQSTKSFEEHIENSNTEINLENPPEEVVSPPEKSPINEEKITITEITEITESTESVITIPPEKPTKNVIETADVKLKGISTSDKMIDNRVQVISSTKECDQSVIGNENKQIGIIESNDTQKQVNNCESISDVKQIMSPSSKIENLETVNVSQQIIAQNDVNIDKSKIQTAETITTETRITEEPKILTSTIIETETNAPKNKNIEVNKSIDIQTITNNNQISDVTTQEIKTIIVNTETVAQQPIVKQIIETTTTPEKQIIEESAKSEEKREQVTDNVDEKTIMTTTTIKNEEHSIKEPSKSEEKSKQETSEIETITLTTIANTETGIAPKQIIKQTVQTIESDVAEKQIINEPQNESKQAIIEKQIELTPKTEDVSNKILVEQTTISSQTIEDSKKTSDKPNIEKDSSELPKAESSSESSSTPSTVVETPLRRASQTVFEDATPVQQQEMMKRRVSTSEISPKQASQAFWLIFSAEYTNAMEKDWHGQHFSCWQCDESLTGQRYVLRDDHPYCVKCYEQVFANPCEKCNRIIGIDSKDLSYKDKHWHEACFQCTTCNESLVDKQFGAKGEKIYCGNCYDKQFASRCDGCSKIFHAGTKKMEYKNRQWHEQCFKCCKCETPIGTKSFIPREKDIYCAGCYEEKFATRCVKCDKAIQSGGVTYKNEPWHRECFTCTHCNKNLAGQRFTSRDDKPCCAECFGRLFAKRCTSCAEPITGIGGTRFISFEDRHWHNDCFICAACTTSLVGRGFITDEDKIICPECAKERFM